MASKGKLAKVPSATVVTAGKTKYTRKAADELLGYIAAGRTLLQFCRDNNMSVGAVRLWTKRNLAPREAVEDDFPSLYASAVLVQAEAWADEMIEIADSTEDKEDAPANKLKVDTRMKLMQANDPARWKGEIKRDDPNSIITQAAAELMADMAREQLAKRAKQIDLKAEETKNGGG